MGIDQGEVVQHEVAGVPAAAIAEARELIEDGAVVVLGRPSLAESGDSIAAAAGALARLPGVRFLSALRRANVMGALDMGLAPGLLPGRVTLAAGREWYGQEWGTIPEEPGLDAAGVLGAAADGRIQGLVLLGADPLSDFPDRELARQGLAGAGFVVAVDTFLTASSRQADVVLPAAAYAERPGTTTNIEGRITRLGQKMVPPGVAWPDWMIAGELAARLGGGLGPESLEELWDEVSRLAPSHVGATRALLADPRHRDGVVPPLRGGLDAGRQRPSRATATDANVGATEEEPSQIDPMATPGLQETEAHAVAVTAVRPIGPGDLGQAGVDGDQGRPALLELEAPEEPPLPPVDAYSLRLIATRTLYGDGTLVQRSPSLAPLAPAPTARLNPYDLERLGSSDRTRVALPVMEMFFPGCCFSLVSSSATLPLISVEFCHSTRSRVVETTYLGTLLMWLAYGSSVEVGQ
jgi:NADH-quinone oxidoreductase subunit G